MSTTQSYTVQLVDSMINAMIEDKLCKGYTKLNNGLFEDILGQVYTVVLEQAHEDFNGDELGQMSTISLKLKPVSIAGRL